MISGRRVTAVGLGVAVGMLVGRLVGVLVGAGEGVLGRTRLGGRVGAQQLRSAMPRRTFPLLERTGLRPTSNSPAIFLSG